MTKTQAKRLIDVDQRAKGHPVGIPCPKAMAHRLVRLGYAEWAPPAFLYPKPVYPRFE